MSGIESFGRSPVSSLRCLLGLCAALLAAPLHAVTPTGAWQCTSMLGDASLVFDGGEQLTFDGEAMPYVVDGNRIVTLQYGIPRVHPFELNGNRLRLVTPEGMEIVCQQAGGGARNGAGAVASQGAAGGGGANGVLVGMMCGSAGSYSSGGSTQRNVRVSFDGRGRFTTGGDSSFSGAAGFGYGEAAAEGGTYQVAAATPGAPIRVRWDNGEDDEARVHHVVDGRITEIMYGSQLLGLGLCDY